MELYWINEIIPDMRTLFLKYCFQIRNGLIFYMLYLPNTHELKSKYTFFFENIYLFYHSFNEALLFR